MTAVEVTIDGPIATVTMNEPQVRNALTAEMQDGLVRSFSALHRDRAVRVVILEGAGRAFSAGGHIAAFSEHDDNNSDPNAKADTGESGPIPSNELPPTQYDHRLRLQRLQEVILATRRCEKPVLAAIDGPAVGGGLDLALSCDIRYATKRSRFGAVFSRIGLFPGTGGTFLLQQAVGISRALELVWSGEIFDSDLAAELGIVRTVFDDRDALDAGVRAHAQQLAEGPPLAISLAKAAMYRATDHNIHAIFDFIATAESITLASEDHQEGVASFRAERAPQFRGR